MNSYAPNLYAGGERPGMYYRSTPAGRRVQSEGPPQYRYHTNANGGAGFHHTPHPPMNTNHALGYLRSPNVVRRLPTLPYQMPPSPVQQLQQGYETSGVVVTEHLSSIPPVATSSTPSTGAADTVGSVSVPGGPDSTPPLTSSVAKNIGSGTSPLHNARSGGESTTSASSGAGQAPPQPPVYQTHPTTTGTVQRSGTSRSASDYVYRGAPNGGGHLPTKVAPAVPMLKALRGAQSHTVMQWAPAASNSGIAAQMRNMRVPASISRTPPSVLHYPTSRGASPMKRSGNGSAPSALANSTPTPPTHLQLPLLGSKSSRQSPIDVVQVATSYATSNSQLVISNTEDERGGPAATMVLATSGNTSPTSAAGVRRGRRSSASAAALACVDSLHSSNYDNDAGGDGSGTPRFEYDDHDHDHDLVRGVNELGSQRSRQRDTANEYAIVDANGVEEAKVDEEADAAAAAGYDDFPHFDIGTTPSEEAITTGGGAFTTTAATASPSAGAALKSSSHVVSPEQSRTVLNDAMEFFGPVPPPAPTTITTTTTSSVSSSHRRARNGRQSGQSSVSRRTIVTSSPMPVNVLPPRMAASTPPMPLDLVDRPVGLFNFGATCYMNAALQCLLHTPLLLNSLAQDMRRALKLRNADAGADGMERGGMKEESYLANTFGGTYPLVQLGLKHPKEPPTQLLLAIKNAAAKENQEFRGHGQNDAHEFLRTILHVVHKEVNRGAERGEPYAALKDVENESETEAMQRWMQSLRSVDDSTVYDFFGGFTRSRTECRSCGLVSYAFDPFLDLTVPVTQPKRFRGAKSRESIPDAVDARVREVFLADHTEEFNGKNQLHCGRCKGLRDVIHQSCVRVWPHILVLHLNRFNAAGRKNSSKMVYPHSFMLGDNAYRLFGVCCHSGSERSGHYKSYVCMRNSAAKEPSKAVQSPIAPFDYGGDAVYDNGAAAATTTTSTDDASGSSAPQPGKEEVETWYRCNDDKVEPVDVKLALGELENAYILFYIRRPTSG